MALSVDGLGIVTAADRGKKLRFTLAELLGQLASDLVQEELRASELQVLLAEGCATLKPSVDK